MDLGWWFEDQGEVVFRGFGEQIAKEGAKEDQNGLGGGVCVKAFETLDGEGECPYTVSEKTGSTRNAAETSPVGKRHPKANIPTLMCSLHQILPVLSNSPKTQV